MPLSWPGTGAAAPSAERGPRLAERALAAAFALACAQLAGEHRLPRRGERSPAELEAELGIALSRDGLPFDEVVARRGALLAATPSAAGRRFFKQLFGGRDPIAMVAEMLTPPTR